MNQVMTGVYLLYDDSLNYTLVICVLFSVYVICIYTKSFLKGNYECMRTKEAEEEMWTLFVTKFIVMKGCKKEEAWSVVQLC